jgi:hypothetical protein
VENCSCVLPKLEEALNALKAIEAKGEYYFWSGTSKPKSAVGDYQRALRTLFDLAKTPRIQRASIRVYIRNRVAHRRDSLEIVAAFLGHCSAKEKRYSHWVKGRLERLEEAVKNSWDNWSQWVVRLVKIDKNPFKNAGI